MITLQIFDVFKKKEILTIKKREIVNIYLCGPTVYDHVHIGNLRPVIIFDVLIRTFKFLKIKTKYVNNITDIDDKIIQKAQEKKAKNK